MVSFGFETQAEADEARRRLGDLALEPHELTAAWEDHEDWDNMNANPRPDPRHPHGRHGHDGQHGHPH
jgi:hypothetical protein